MISNLMEWIAVKKNPTVVGLDPILDYVPEYIKERCFNIYGETLHGAAQALMEFNAGLIDSICDLVPAVKIQSAMYEQYGIEGLMAYKAAIDHAHKRDLLVIGDVKRGDIGSTSTAYAAGHLGTVKVGNATYAPFDEDFATVNPYLGSDGVKPFMDVCRENNKGIFVLVKTSNPSSGEFQDREIDGKPLYKIVGEQVARWGDELMDGSYSDVGAVVGATYPQMGKELREIMPHIFILVPGYGAQGATAKDLVHFFDKDGMGAIVNSSRGIITAYKQEKYAKYTDADKKGYGFADAARAAVIDMKEDINKALV